MGWMSVHARPARRRACTVRKWALLPFCSAMRLPFKAARVFSGASGLTSTAELSGLAGSAPT